MISQLLQFIDKNMPGVIQLLKKLSKIFTNSLSFSNLSSRMKFIVAIGLAIIFKLYLKSRNNIPIPSVTQMSISQFLNPLNISSLERVKIYPNIIIAKDKFSNLIKTLHGGMPSNVLYNQLRNSSAQLQYMGNYVNNSKLDFFLLLVSFSSALLIYFLYRKNTQTKKPSRPVQKVMFDDIIGLDTAKNALKQVLDFMMMPQKYQERGARMRRGVLLHGPPGTGKTTLAKACANEAGIPFYSCNAAQFCEIYVGMGPKKVRQLFATARQNSPSVIFIDELDALGSRSEHGVMFDTANSQKNSTINQILSEIDGFQTNDRVLVIAATNRLQMVDKSLIRSGRFDLKVSISLPPMEMKVKIFKKYLNKTKNNLNEEFIRKLLERSQFCSGADIQALVNEAIYLSMRRNSYQVEDQDITNAIKQSTN